MSKLKAVIISIRDVIVRNGVTEAETLNGVVKLIRFLQSRNVQPIVLTSGIWETRETGSNITERLEEMLFREVDKFPWYCCEENLELPKKDGSAKPVDYILKEHNLEPNEAVYIGNSDIDMRTALNSKMLFLNARWYESNTDYGFIFETPKDIAKFIDTFCIREHWWEFAIESNGLRVYALSTFSNYIERYDITTTDAKKAAKEGTGNLEFWARYLVSSIYFSGLYTEIDYIAPYPGHRTGSGNADIGDALSIFAKCFKKTYIENLIIRHTQSEKSQTLRQAKQQPTHVNQLNSIHLNKNPVKNKKGDTYKNSPLKKGKTVLIVDDFLTEGFSLDAARQYIQAAKADVISLAWLKTLNRDYHKGEYVNIVKPYEPNVVQQCGTQKTFGYRDHIVDQQAQDELGQKFFAYETWDWPQGLG